MLLLPVYRSLVIWNTRLCVYFYFYFLCEYGNGKKKNNSDSNTCVIIRSNTFVGYEYVTEPIKCVLLILCFFFCLSCHIFTYHEISFETFQNVFSLVWDCCCCCSFIFFFLHFSFQCISDSVLSAKTYFNPIRWLTREKFNWFLEIVIGILLYNLLFWWHYYVRDYLLKHLEITSIVEPIIIIITIIIIMLFRGNKMEEEPTSKRKKLKQIHSNDIFIIW